MVGSAAKRAASTPSAQLRVQWPAGWSHRKPSSPVPTRWLSSIDLMYVDISSTHAVSMSELQPGSRGNRPEPPQRGSLASSQAMIVGSSLYATPVMVLTRLSRWEIQSLYHWRIVGSV